MDERVMCRVILDYQGVTIVKEVTTMGYLQMEGKLAIVTKDSKVLLVRLLSEVATERMLKGLRTGAFDLTDYRSELATGFDVINDIKIRLGL